MSQGDLFPRPTPVDGPLPPMKPVRVPYQRTSETSQAGARVVVKTWTARQSAVLQLLAGGPKTRQELAGLTPYGINGICSVVKALIDKGEIERTGDCDLHVDGNGDVTKRERLQIRR